MDGWTPPAIHSVGMLIKEKIAYQLIDPAVSFGLSPEHFEVLLARTSLKKCTCLLWVIYRPPGSSLNEFYLELNRLLWKISSNSKHLMIAGDFNIDLLRVDDESGTGAFFNTTSAYNRLPTITRPTRITTHSSTLIDNAFFLMPGRI